MFGYPDQSCKGKCWCFCIIFIENINSSIKSSTFPSCFELADVTPLHKKGKNKT